MMQRAWSFPGSGMDDSEIVQLLGLQQPMEGISFKSPQLLALERKSESPRMILSLDKGMGKTLTYLRMAEEVAAPQTLLACTKGSMLRQKQDAEKFFPGLLEEMVFIKGGQAAQREKDWNKKGRYYVCTYATLLADMGARLMSKTTGQTSSRIAPSWTLRPRCLIGDEYHRVLRNKGSATHKLWKALEPEHLILSSGSAANKGPQSLWTALNVCDPKVFSSYWAYVGRYCVTQDTHFGKQIVGVKNREEWRNAIAPYIFHRLKDLKDYPEKTRASLPVEMEPWQRKIHDELKRILFTELPSGALLLAPNTLAATHKIRQLLVCPKFLDESLGWGAGLEGILEDYQDSELTHAVVSTAYTGPIDLIKRFFAIHKIPAFSLQGGMDMDSMEVEIKKWTEQGGIMIQSIEFAESYELPSATNMYMLGYLHDPERNKQAEDRIHRDKRVTPHPVNIWYVKHVGAYDENVLEALVQHSDNVEYLMNLPLNIEDGFSL